ncbi:50S ribosomal protein L6, chloroplastic, partial [Linum perenne]
VSSNLRSTFWGGTRGISVSPTPIRRVNFARTVVECKESRIGKQPIPVPGNVTIKLEEQYFEVKGPLGQLSRSYPPEVKLVMDENGVIRVIKAMETRRANQFHGLYRTLTDNMVVGVSKGFEKRLTLEGNDLVLNLGFSHPVRMKIPDNLKVKVEENTRIIISGYDKCDIGLFAASIRRWRPPEPYKGKGVRYANEVVKLKEGKAGKKK